MIKNDYGNEEYAKAHGLLMFQHKTSRLNKTADEIVAEFEAEGCVVHEIGREIVETGTRRRVYKTVTYTASCGHEASIRLQKWCAGQGRICARCRRPRGARHHAWNPNLTDEQRLFNRDTFDNIKWRESVYQRDNYACQVCGDSRGGNLVAHHLNGYADFPEERFDLNNGITLCETCHKAFHHVYTYFHNTRQQFEEWVIEQGNTEVTTSGKTE